MRTLTIAGSRVVVEPGLVAKLAPLIDETVRAHRLAIVTDSNVGPLHARAVRAALAKWSPIDITIPAGEAHKTRESWAHVTDELLANGFARDSAIVALGGGVVGDLAGFVAATYMRGIPVIQIPTSLVAMIDASLGGKTGVDAPAGKNLVGAFHAPALVAVDPDFLQTLPPRELRGGLAEALKHGAIADEAYFERVAQSGSSAPIELVARSIEIKGEVVNADPREQGRRKVLNFGHTLGHAIEAESAYSLSHGEAIAIGMALESRLGAALRVTSADVAPRIEAALSAIGLPTTTSLDAGAILARTRTDKKSRGGEVEYALPARVGHFERWTTPADDDVVASILRGTA